MFRGDDILGVMILYKLEVQPFSDKQIEPGRDLRRPGRHRHREHAAARQYAKIGHEQTATADVLKVISRSAFDLQAVLDTLVKSAASDLSHSN